MTERPVVAARAAAAATAGGPRRARAIAAEALVALLESGLDRVLLIDSRPFVDYNAAHVLEAVNVNCSKLMKRRLQQDKVHIAELLQHSAKRKLELQGDQEVVVYDLGSTDPGSLPSDSFLSVLLAKLERTFPSVHLLAGGFSQFSQLFPGLCEGKATLAPCCASSSQPCPPVTSPGPTRILPHLYLGCQRDVLNKDLMQQNDIVFVLNASNTCPKPDFISDTHFLRVPVNDSFCEKILPWLDKSVEFIERAKASNGRVLVHCLAGISRSATIAIAYIMKRMDMSLDEAYRFVKEKRPTISPNFNFLGQLLDFEKKIKSPVATDARWSNSVQSEAAAEAEPPGAPREAEGDGVGGACPETDAAAAAAAAWLEPLTLPCVLAAGPEDRARLKRSFSLDIKSYGELGGASGVGVGVGGAGGVSGGGGGGRRWWRRWRRWRCASPRLRPAGRRPRVLQAVGLQGAGQQALPVLPRGGGVGAVHAGAQPGQGAGGRAPGPPRPSPELHQQQHHLLLLLVLHLHLRRQGARPQAGPAAPQRQPGGGDTRRPDGQLPAGPVPQPAAPGPPRRRGLRPEGLAFGHPAGARRRVHVLAGRRLVPLRRRHALLLHVRRPGRRRRRRERRELRERRERRERRRGLRGLQLLSGSGGGAAAGAPEERRPRGLAAELARGELLREAAEETLLPDGVWRRDAGEPVPGGDGEGGQPGQLLRQHGDHRGFLRGIVVLRTWGL
ncbi:unnamed protein product [Gadus morhua 'NCC']